MDTLMELSRWQKMNTCELWNLVVVLMYYNNVSENMEWMNSENLAKWTYVVCSELVFVAANCVVCSESGFRCRIVLSAAMQVFAAEFVLSVANMHLLPKVCCLQRTGVAESVMSAANLYLLPKLCWSQRINIRCWNFVLSAAN